MEKLNRKGMLAVVMVFVMALSFAAASLIYMFYARAGYTASVLRRMRGVSYAEAALFEALNRFRINYLAPGETLPWDAAAWAGGTPPTTTTVTLDDQDRSNNQLTVDIDVDEVGSAAGSRKRVTATIDLDNIRM